MKNYDVIIVGAGPAGATAARTLALHGARVIILEKESLPRYKPCGGGVTGRAASLLPAALPVELVEDHTYRVTLTFRGRWPVTVNDEKPIVYMTMRQDLDYWLAEQAVAAGAVLHDQARVSEVAENDGLVTVRSSRGTYQGRVLIGADGVNSTVARQVGLAQNHLRALALELELGVSPELLDKYRGSVLLDYGFRPNGYGWIFPKRSHLSIGVGFSSHSGAQLKEFMKRFRKQRGLSGEVLNQRGFFLSVGGGSYEPLQAGRTLLVGDAAGLVDPLFGEGIFYALRSGNLAASVIIDSLEAAGPSAKTLTEGLSHYSTLLKTDLLHELRTIRRFSEFFYHWSGWFHAAFMLRPPFLRRVMKALAGDVDVLDVLPVKDQGEKADPISAGS